MSLAGYRFLIVCGLGLAALTVARPAEAAGLAKPLAGNPSVNSWFDHDAPGNGVDGAMVRYDGAQWSNASVTSCELGDSCYDGHDGIDFQASMDSNVLAAEAGTIETYWDPYGGGNMARIWHPALGYATVYAHLDNYAVTSGTVARGQVIGKSGCSGSTCTGPHLHFSVFDARMGGHAVDPYGWTGAGLDPYPYDHGSLWGPPALAGSARPNNLYVLDLNNTGSGRTEVHILDRTANYQSFMAHIPTAEGPVSPATYQFKTGDYNRDGNVDVYEIKMNSTGSGTTEVHVLDGATNYQSYLLHTGTALGQTSLGQWAFDLADYNNDGWLDLYCLALNQTGSHSTEAHVLDGATNFQTFLLHTGTPLMETSSAEWQWGVADWNRDGHADVVGIRHLNTGTGRTEVHVLDGATSYHYFILQTGTGEGQTSDQQYRYGLGDYNGNGSLDVFEFKLNNTGSGMTEVHVLNGTGNYQNFLLHTGTAQPMVSTSSALPLLF